jgi:hypothetical protein
MPPKRAAKKVVEPPPAIVAQHDEGPRMTEVQWNQDDASSFTPIIGTELYWLWTKEDRAAYPSCRIKGDVRVVMLTKPATHEDEFEITFRCGMKRDVSDDELRKRCDTHNQFVANKTQGMILQRTIAVREERTPAYCVGGGFTMLTDGSDEPPPSLDVTDPLKEPTENSKEGESIAEDGDPSNAKEKETDAIMDERKDKATEHDTFTEA